MLDRIKIVCIVGIHVFSGYLVYFVYMMGDL